MKFAIVESPHPIGRTGVSTPLNFCGDLLTKGAPKLQNFANFLTAEVPVRLRYPKIWHEFSIFILEKVMVEKFTDKYFFINKFSLLQAKNVVNISQKTNHPAQKVGDQVNKGAPWISQFYKPLFRTKVQNFQPPFQRGGGVGLSYASRSRLPNHSSYLVWMSCMEHGCPRYLHEIKVLECLLDGMKKNKVRKKLFRN